MIKQIKQGSNYIELIEKIENREVIGCLIVNQCLYYSESSCGLVTNSSSDLNDNGEAIDNNLRPQMGNQLMKIFIFLLALIGGFLSFKNFKNKK